MEISDEIFEQAKVVAAALQKELEPRVLGRRLPTVRCNCGAVHSVEAEAEAVAVQPGGGKYHEQIGYFPAWTVRMRKISSETRAMRTLRVLSRKVLPSSIVERLLGSASKEDDGFDLDQGLDAFLPIPELESMFIRRFSGISVPLLF